MEIRKSLPLEIAREFVLIRGKGHVPDSAMGEADEAGGADATAGAGAVTVIYTS